MSKRVHITSFSLEFCLAGLCFQILLPFLLIKESKFIQYGYRKCGTHARVLSETLAHGNNKNDDKDKEEEGKKRSVNIERSTGGKK